MKYKLIAFDLDDTFLNRSKGIPEENIRAVCAAAEQGAYIVPATGRVYNGIPEGLRELPFTRYFLTVNGAYVYDAAEDRVLHRAEIDCGTALKAMAYFDTVPHCIYDCYQDNWGWINKSFYDKAGDYVPNPGILDLLLRLRRPVEDLQVHIREKNDPVQKLQLYFNDMEERERQLRLLPELFPELSISSSIAGNIEINSSSATKGQALRALADILGIDISETIAFGDGTNDTDMIRTAGLGVAMANAAAGAKAAADYITGDCDDAGVAAAIRKFVLC